jgi:hypothetical protein
LSSALVMPSIRTVRTMPPAPGSSPSVTSGWPNTAFGSSTAIRRWQASAISSPPPSALPLSTATTGMPSVSSPRSDALTRSVFAPTASASSGRAWISSLRSPPAKKVDFAEVTITPRRSSRSRCSAWTTRSRSSTNRARMVFTGWAGSSIVRVTIPSSCVRWIVSVCRSSRVVTARPRSAGRGWAVRPARRWWRCPCRRRCRGSPCRWSGRAVRARRRPCRAASRRSPRGGGPSRSRRR